MLSQTDPRGLTTTFAYDPLNHLTQLTDARGGLTRFTYDGNGNLLTVTDARGSVTPHTYDAMDRLAARTDPVGGIESFAYDGVGNLIRHVDRKGQGATFSYDALNRRTGATYADGSTASFAYDSVGRLIQATDSVGGTILNTYDPLDRLLAQTTGLGTVSYAYDALGRRTRLDTPGQASVFYGYDAASRLRTITQAPLNPVTLEYDALGRRTLLTLPNGVSTAYQYDAASRLTALIYRNALGPLGDLTYQYDAAGNRTKVGGSFARTLLPDAITSATYNAANRQLTFGAKSMTYDASGNLTSITDPTSVTTFTWDARNRLVALTNPTTTASFTYDALGRRLAKQITGQLTQYLYDGLDIIEELAAQGPIAYLRSLNIDEPLVRNGTEFYLADALGSILSLTDSSAALMTRYVYEPFGRTTLEGAPSPNLFQYTGRENDETTLYYYRERYYAPQQMRFVASDIWNLAYLKTWMNKQFLLLRAGSDTFGTPLGDVLRQAFLSNPSLHNSYSYAGNNPVRFTDPLGLYYIDAGLNVPIFGPFGGFSIDVQIQLDSKLNLERLNLVPGVYIGAPGIQVLGVTGDPIPGPQGSLSGGFWFGGSATLCGNGARQSLCSIGAGFSTPGVAVEIIQYGFNIYTRK